MENQNEIVKTVSLKVKDYGNYPIMEAIREYSNYYNKLSKWINANFLTMKIGDFDQILPEECKTFDYYSYMMSDEWINEPIYKMFTKSFKTKHCNNIIYNALKVLNPEGYNGNIMGISNTAYRRQGYFASVLSNYRTKLSTKKKIKTQKLSENPTEEELFEQCLCEVINNNYTSNEAWEEQIDYLEMRGKEKETYLNRLKPLYEYYKQNTEKIKEHVELRKAEELIEFGGCVRKDDKLSMCLECTNNEKYIIELNKERNGYIITFGTKIKFEAYGNRLCLKNGVEIFDLKNNHTLVLNFVVKDNQLYVNIPFRTAFSKNKSNMKKSVGVDVNMKHSLFTTSIEHNEDFKDFVNIYKECLNDQDFINACPKHIINFFKDFSNYVFFMPIEMELILSRIMNQFGYEHIGEYKKLYKTEIAFTNVLNKLEQKFKDNNDNEKRIYIQNVNELRRKIKAYFVLKYTYSKYQQQYDLDMGYVDKSTKSKEEMDQRRMLNPFRNTKTAKDILSKLKNISQVIIGCRNNIASYMYRLFEKNGYDTIVMEKLESSQMDKYKRIPTINSFLYYNETIGHTIEEIKEMKIWNVIEKNYYNLIFDDNGKLTNATLTDKGISYLMDSEFYNLTLKAIHFADAKDYFTTLSNNGNLSVVLVPSQFTSQMDSVTHTIYTKKDKKGKQTILNKKEVRDGQEIYKPNNLNADYNAARNIVYIFENKDLRENLLKETKNKYNETLYNTDIKTSGGVIKQLKKFKDKYINEMKEKNVNDKKIKKCA